MFLNQLIKKDKGFDYQQLLASFYVYQHNIIYVDNEKNLMKVIDLEELCKGLGISLDNILSKDIEIKNNDEYQTIKVKQKGLGDDIEYYVVQKNECYKEILFDYRDIRGEQKLKLWIPNLLFVCRKQEGKFRLRVFAFRGELTKDTDLYLPNITNINSAGGMCLGSTNIKTDDYLEFIDKYFYKSYFNSDMADTCSDKGFFWLYNNANSEECFNYLKKISKYGELK
jgi:hypothetical protein